MRSCQNKTERSGVLGWQFRISSCYAMYASLSDSEAAYVAWQMLVSAHIMQNARGLWNGAEWKRSQVYFA